MYKVEKVYENNTTHEVIVENKKLAMETFYEALKDLDDIKFINVYKKNNIFELKFKYIKKEDTLKFF